MLEALGRAHQTRYTGHTIPYRWFSCIFTPLLTPALANIHAPRRNMPLVQRSGHVPIVYVVGVEGDEGPIAREIRLAALCGVKSEIRHKT